MFPASNLHKDHFLATYLKGVAILAVISLHLYTFISPHSYLSSPQNLFILLLDQVMRFCVPLFIALSGFGLSLKYQHQPFHSFQFIRQRLSKLLPLYLVWSTYYLLLSKYIDPWWKVLHTGPIWRIILYGWADYHLYFVSVIFQLYFVFLLYMKTPVKLKKFWLPLSLITQLTAYYSFFIHPISDQIQNTWFFSWIFYFIFGSWLANQKKFLASRLNFLIMIIGLVWSVIDSVVYLGATQNIILAIRSTKLPIIIYSFGFISFFLTVSSQLPFKKTLLWLGNYSFIIYLAHPIPLHLLKFEPNQVPWTPVILSYVILLILSIKMTKK